MWQSKLLRQGQQYSDPPLVTLISSELYCTCVVMCDTYRYIEVSRYFENIAIRYSMLVYRYFY